MPESLQEIGGRPKTGNLTVKDKIKISFDRYQFNRQKLIVLARGFYDRKEVLFFPMSHEVTKKVKEYIRYC